MQGVEAVQSVEAVQGVETVQGAEAVQNVKPLHREQNLWRRFYNLNLHGDQHPDPDQKLCALQTPNNECNLCNIDTLPVL